MNTTAFRPVVVIPVFDHEHAVGAMVDGVLAVGQARTLQASFHCPENTGNAAQQTRMSFVLCADAVQTKNNPTGLFD